MHPAILFLHHLFNVMTLVLFFALALSLAVHEWIESVILGVVIVTNAVIGFMQEYRSGAEL